MGDAAVVDQFQLGDHVCWVSDDDSDRLDAMARLVAAGMRAGHRILYLTESLMPRALVAGLEERGVPMQGAQRTGQVQVLAARDVYLSGGRFDRRRMIVDLDRRIEEACASGFCGLRVVGDMAWAVAHPPEPGQLARYESRLNRLFLDGRALAVCLYDRRAFDREMLRAVATAHQGITSGRDSPADAALLRIQRTDRPQGLRLVGEADLSNRYALAAALDEVLDRLPDPAAPVVIDAEQLRFADVAAARLLVAAACAAPAGLRIVGCHRPVALVLDHLGVGQEDCLDITTYPGASTVPWREAGTTGMEAAL